MLLSVDKNGELIRKSYEQGTVTSPHMVEDSHLAIGEYKKDALKDLSNLRKQNYEKQKVHKQRNLFGLSFRMESRIQKTPPII